MTKKEAEKYFKEVFATELATTFKVDKPMRREAWNNFTDMLLKDSDITHRQYNTWSHPKFIA